MAPPDLLDDFNRADATPASASAEGWSWQQNTVNNLIIVNGRLYADVANSVSLGRSSFQFDTSDMYAEVVAGGVSTYKVGVAVRVNVTANDAYAFYKNDFGASFLVKLIAGVETVLVTGPTGLASASNMRLEVRGDQLTCLVNNVQVIQTTDTSIPGGTQAGVFLVSINGAQRANVDTWIGGPLSHRIRKAANRPKVEEFLASGTWTKPDGARYVRVTCVGGGGGGGSGRNDTGAIRNGGTGGTGAGLSSHVFDAADLTSTVAITVGAGGVGGASQVPVGNGNVGTAGGTSSFGSYLRAVGGGAGVAGNAGTTANPVTPTSGATDLPGAAAQSISGTPGAVPAVNTTRGGTGGGGGGGYTSGGVQVAAAGGGIQNVLGLPGGTGGGTTGVGSDGQNGPAGAGGGGGASAAANAGFTGGNGGLPGGGGGGGGSGTPSGAGGNGGNGSVLIETYF